MLQERHDNYTVWGPDLSSEHLLPDAGDIDLETISDEGRIRKPGGIIGISVTILGLIWSGFHFYTIGFGMLTSLLQRSAHLSIGLALCYLYFPFDRKKSDNYDHIPWYDILFALVGFLSIYYVFHNYSVLVRRVGLPTQTDLFMGALAVLFILGAAYRAFGIILPAVTVVFLVYPFVGQYLPMLLGHGGYRIQRVINDLYMTNAGIFGIPIGVSATFVFAFVLFGSFFQTSGAAKYIVQISFALLGRFRGGPAKAAVLASGFMGSIAGSSVANTVVTGSITIPTMKDTGFSAEVAGGVETAASTNGQFLPPIMGAAAFIMAEFTGIPYWQIALSAVLPAVISYAGLLGMVHLQAAKTGMRPMKPAEIPPFFRTFFHGIFYWIPIGVLVYYLLVLRRTPFAAGYIAILTVLVIILVKRLVLFGFHVHGRTPPVLLAGGSVLPGISDAHAHGEADEISSHPEPMGLVEAGWKLVKGLWDDFISGLDNSARSMSGIAVACACAGIIVGVVTLTGVGMSTTLLFSVVAGDNLFILLLGSAILSIILGLGLPTTAKYAVMATLVAPAILTVAPQLPVVAVHLFILYYAILADDTPPVGVAAYAAAAISGADPIRTGWLGFKFDLSAFLLPFMFVYNTEFLLIDTTWYQATLIGATSLFGIYCFSAVIQRWLVTRLSLWEMAILLAIALAMVWPTLITDLLSVLAFSVLYSYQRFVKAPKVNGSGGDGGASGSSGVGPPEIRSATLVL